MTVTPVLCLNYDTSYFTDSSWLFSAKFLQSYVFYVVGFVLVCGKHSFVT